ncbi:MAG: polysaccharide deacetylase family protein [Clostridia bacterium]|nr:polysaccharide deacetylase family protein [Clostridia bacterium]
MKKINNVIIYTISITCIFVFTVSVAKLNEIRDIKEVVQTSYTIESVEGLSNKKIGWGIKRNDNHNQPDVGTLNKQILDKYEGYSIGNKDSKKVYLTFDEGYEAGYTEKILEVLKQNEVNATFFITAHYVNTQPELVQKMIDEGHIIGNHTVNHKSMPDLDTDTIKKEVMNLHTSIYEKYNYEMKYIRPPKGEYSEKTVAYTKNLGYTTVMWSLAYDDWDEKKQGREDYAKQKILDNIHDGTIILLHGNSKDNTNVLDYCIKEIKKMGYEFKSLDEFER